MSYLLSLSQLFAFIHDGRSCTLYGEKMQTKFQQLKKKGQGLVEYALILVLIAIVVILILTFLGGKVNSTFSRIGSGLS